MYETKNIPEARKMLAETFGTFEHLVSKEMVILEEGFENVMAVMNLPEKYRKRLRTTNSIERLNEEIRSHQIVRFNLNEQDEKWLSRRYLDMQEYYNFINEKESTKNQSIA